MVSLLLGLLAGVVGLGACVAAASGVLAATGSPSPLGDSSTWAALARSCLGMGLWAVIGVGVGALVRNQVAAIVAVLAFSQFVEPLLRFGMAWWRTCGRSRRTCPARRATRWPGRASSGQPAAVRRWTC